jgi:hypothetical protein
MTNVKSRPDDFAFNLYQAIHLDVQAININTKIHASSSANSELYKSVNKR